MEGAFYGAQKKQHPRIIPPCACATATNNQRGRKPCISWMATVGERVSASCEPLTAGLVKVAGDTVSVPATKWRRLSTVVDLRGPQPAAHTKGRSLSPPAYYQGRVFLVSSRGGWSLNLAQAALSGLAPNSRPRTCKGCSYQITAPMIQRASTRSVSGCLIFRLDS